MAPNLAELKADLSKPPTYPFSRFQKAFTYGASLAIAYSAISSLRHGHIAEGSVALVTSVGMIALPKMGWSPSGAAIFRPDLMSEPDLESSEDGTPLEADSSHIRQV